MKHATVIVVWLAACVLLGCSKNNIPENLDTPAVIACDQNTRTTGYRWVPGRWSWKKKDGAYVWREGRWTTGRRHTKWVEGYWIPTRKGDKKGFRYIAGHWR